MVFMPITLGAVRIKAGMNSAINGVINDVELQKLVRGLVEAIDF
jgi:hypothetical protein